MKTSAHDASAPHGRLRAKAFTLIELLVVIAVIAILASLLLPALTRVKIAADSAVCKSNLHQHGLAFQMYVDDFKIYPPTAMIDAQQGGIIRWEERLRRYTGAQTFSVSCLDVYGQYKFVPSGVQICPSYARLRGELDLSGDGSYGYNGEGYAWPAGGELGLGGVRLTQPQGTGAQTGSADLRLVRENDVAQPSEMIAIGDSRFLDGDWLANWGIPLVGSDDLSANGPDLVAALAMGLSVGFTAPQIVNGPRWIGRRHNGRWQVGFCDGHVESLRTPDLWDPRSEIVIRRWNRDHQPHLEYVLGW